MTEEWTEVAPGVSVNTTPCEGCGERPVRRWRGDPWTLRHRTGCRVAAEDAAQDACDERVRDAEAAYDAIMRGND